MSDHPEIPAKPTLAGRIGRDKASPLPWKTATSRGLISAAILDAIGFVVLAGLGAVLLATTARFAALAGWRSGSGTGRCANGPR